MSIPDRIHSELIREAIEVMRYEAGLRQRVLKLLDQLGRDLVRELADAGLDTKRTDWQRARLRQLLDVAEKRSQEVYGQISDLTSEEARGLVEIQGDKIIKRMNTAIGAQVLTPVNWTNEQIAAIADDTLIFGAKSGEWWSRQAVDFQQAFADQMRMGMLRGEAMGDLVKRVRGIDGLMNISKRNAEKLVRSSVISVANEAHLAAFEANEDVMAGIEWTATLDKRTCPRCGALDGLQWDMKRQPIGHSIAFPGPVLHWNDRCTQLPVTKSWEELAKASGGNTKLARELDKIPKGERASMGGAVSADTTFEGWLKGLKPEDQIQILGQGRYDLWRKQGMSFTDMIRQDGNAISLDELRRL